MNKAYQRSINYAACEAYLWDVTMSLTKRHTLTEAGRMTHPLGYWLRTGRASAGHLHGLFAIQPWRVAKVLEGYGESAPIDEVLPTILEMAEAKARKLGWL